MSPIPTLVAAFLQMLLIRHALGGATQDPFSKFTAAMFYLAKLYAFVRHADLDAGDGMVALPA